ncbi:MAG: hypothetical protein EU533_08885 [Promethearchaeota archaeon]|nr:MAG: hypothetical protein EU533_08885 [Candidatus Lokiarchaeota archaeon]
MHTTSFQEQPTSKNSLTNFRVAVYKYNQEHGVDLIQQEIEAHAQTFSKILNTKILFGGDGDSWVISGIKEYFPNSIYLLCLYHLFKKFKESLGRRKEEQKPIKGLLLSNQINKALLKIDQMIRNPYDLKEKDKLVKLYTYISRNRQGITNQFRLKDKGIGRTGAIESNINKVIAARFKKKGMSWTKLGALSLLKIKEAILNNEWDNWWETERERNIKVGKYKPPLPVAYFNKETESSPIVEVTIPALRGPDQGKP